MFSEQHKHMMWGSLAVLLVSWLYIKLSYGKDLKYVQKKGGRGGGRGGQGGRGSLKSTTEWTMKDMMKTLFTQRTFVEEHKVTKLKYSWIQYVFPVLL